METSESSEESYPSYHKSRTKVKFYQKTYYISQLEKSNFYLIFNRLSLYI